MELSSDPYEQKLFSMFESCDTDHSGQLDVLALQRLCEMLELRDNGAVLIDGLIANGNTKIRVSFATFKEGLLNFLGMEQEGAASPAPLTRELQISIDMKHEVSKEEERSCHITDDRVSQPSDREVSPKLIVGAKKYGRRSRPHIIGNESSPSDSEETEGNCNSDGSNNIVQRSASQTDIAPSRSRSIIGNSKLKRCASLPAQKNPRNRDHSVRLNKSSTTQTTTMPHDTTLAILQCNSNLESFDIPIPKETMAAHKIVEILDRANIANGRGILLSLGFDEEEVNLTQLSKVIDEELRTLEEEVQTTLLKTSLALQTSELVALRRSFRQLHAENEKLRADSKDANRRVALLAQEIDERHASLEDTTHKEIRMLEQRHAEAVRDLTTRLSNDRESWSNLTQRLEAKLKTFEQDEAKLKIDLEHVRNENSALLEEYEMLQKQITDLLEANIKLNREIAVIEDMSRSGEESKAVVDKSADEEVVNLVESINALRVENANLRDKNDELLAEVEGLTMEMNRIKGKNKRSPSVGVESNDGGDDPDANTLTMATKRRNDSPSKGHTKDESLRLGKLRKCATGVEGSETSDTSGDWVALNSELRNSGAIITSATSFTLQDEENRSALTQKVKDLEQELQALKQAAATTAEERCMELESSLDQMQRAYEECEDYWQSKLSQERQIFEKERQIYEEEQQEGDKKFTELMEKVREYEDQFSKDGRLSPIEEKAMLEQQYADLEKEAEMVRENARIMLEEKTKEIETLRSDIEEMRLRLGENAQIFAWSNEVNENGMEKVSEVDSPASSPISYLWQQSTIQSPIRDQSLENASTSDSKEANRIPVTTSDSATFTTIMKDADTLPSIASTSHNISPIQKPVSTKISPCGSDIGECDSSSVFSSKSFKSPSVASTHSVHRSQPADNCNNRSATTSSQVPSSRSSSTCSPNGIKDEVERLKFFELSLKEQINDLSMQRDSLVMELQQLQEARPVLEKAYARTAHPTLIQRVNRLELKNRHLQNAIKQQQQYTQTLMQQTWQQHHAEVTDLQNRIETQGMIMTEQAQRLQNADILVKELYVENAHLAATVQRLEQQRSRSNLLHQHQHQQPSLNGLPGMP